MFEVPERHLASSGHTVLGVEQEQGGGGRERKTKFL